MKYIIPENKLDNIVFKYLDLNLKDLEKIKYSYMDGMTFKRHNINDPVFFLQNGGTLYIYYELVDKISEIFNLEESDSQSVIGRWFSDRLQLDITDTDLIIYD